MAIPSTTGTHTRGTQCDYLALDGSALPIPCPSIGCVVGPQHGWRPQPGCRNARTEQSYRDPSAPVRDQERFVSEKSQLIDVDFCLHEHWLMVVFLNFSHDTFHSNTFDPDNVAYVEGVVLDFVKSLGKVIRERPTPTTYLFGDKPTILDAHATALLARLLDLGRDDLICDPDIRDYALGIMNTEEWQRITHGRRTLWEDSYGDVSEMDPL